MSNAPLLRQELIAAGFGGEPDFAKLGTRAEKLREYLGPTDYGSRLQESTDLAKLQAALALARRGFAAMGAQPQRGESPIGTLGRTLASPLAGDLGKVASTLYQQRLAAKTAEEAEDRAVKLAAYTQAASRKKGLDAAVLSLLEKQEKGKSSLEKGVSFNYDGQNITGNVSVWRTPKGDKQIIRTVGEHTYTDPKTNKKKIIPAGTYLTGFSKTPVKERIQKGPFEAPKWVLIKDAGGKWKHAGPGGASVQVRQERGGKGELLAPLDTVTLKRRPLKKGEALFSTLPNYLKGTDTTGQVPTASLGATDYNLVYTAGVNKGKPYQVEGRTPIFGTATKGSPTIPIGSFVERGGKGKPFSLQDLANKNLEAKKIETGAPAKPTGLNDPDFKASFSGMLFDLGRLQRTLGIGKTALKIVPANLMVNSDLKPGDKFPFIRVDGIALTKAEQESLGRSLPESYKSYYDRIKVGDVSRADIGAEWAQAQLTKSYRDLGLKPSPPGTQQSREAITDAPAITERYKNAAHGFRTNPVAQETIRNLPFPVDKRNMNSGTGRLVFYDWYGVDFGETTTAPAPNVENRPQKIAGMNRRAIEDRVIAETLSNSVSPLGSTLSPSTANTRPKQMAAVGKAIDDARKKLDDAVQSERGSEVGEAFGRSLNAVALLDRVDAMAHHSGALGIIRGPVEQIGQSKLGISFFDWLKDDKGKEATRLLIAELPVLEQFIARELLKGSGEQRISTPDLKGAQRTLTKMNENQDYSADKLRSLRRYLVNSIKHTASYIGSFHLPDETQKEAARLGVDLKSIKGVNLVYSPYLADSNYAVTKQPVPRYSRAHQDQLRNEGIFTYVAEGMFGQDPQFRLIITDSSGNPIRQSDGSYQTGLYNAREIKKQQHKDMVDFNRNFLMKTYRLDRN